MALTFTREQHGDSVHNVATFELPQEWQQRPPSHLLCDGLNDAWGVYAAQQQALARLGQERTELHSTAAEQDALQADERAAAALLPGEPVTTAALDRLAQDRRTNLVARGGAARATAQAVDTMDAIRFLPEHAALNPLAGPAADKARGRALKLLEELPALLDQVVAWQAALAWTQGSAYRPTRDLRQLVDEITYQLSTGIQQ